jgi:3-dehydroquinate dehydratase / shikimate dehydrogenase
VIIVSITGPSMDDAIKQIRTSRRYADLFEFRLDMIRDPNITGLMVVGRKPCIATCRPVWEGGDFAGTESERIEILEAASLIGVDYVDIELNTDPVILREFLRRKKETRVVVSLHLFDAAVFDAKKLFKALDATRADVVKLAYSAVDAGDVAVAIDFLALGKRAKRKAIAIAMGEAGEASRVLYKKYGGWATYAAPEFGSGSAEGQLRGSELRKVYRAENLTATAKVFGVIGNPVRQSKGVYIHNPLFQKSAINAVYCKFPVDDLKSFIKRMAPHLDGFSVTIPHKRDVIKFLDAVDPTARAIGAVNTVVKKGRKFFGTNTDAAGALDAIEDMIKVKGKRILVIGSGGAARAIAFEAKERGAEVVLANRTEAKARDLAREFGVGHMSMEDITAKDFDILVNATSVGMTPHADRSPVPKAVLKGKVVFDAVYNPPVTKLLSDAKSVGARIIQGTEMYLNQAALQSGLYTGKKADRRLMKRLLKAFH